MQVRKDKRRRVSKEEKLHCSATPRKSIQGLIDDQFQVLVRLEDIVCIWSLLCVCYGAHDSNKPTFYPRIGLGLVR